MIWQQYTDCIVYTVLYIAQLTESVQHAQSIMYSVELYSLTSVFIVMIYNGCKLKGKLLNLACHEDDQNECPYQPEPSHIMAEVKQIIHNMEESHKRDLKILILVLPIIMAVGVSLLFQLMTATMKKAMEQSLMSLKQEMNGNLLLCIQ